MEFAARENRINFSELLREISLEYLQKQKVDKQAAFANMKTLRPKKPTGFEGLDSEEVSQKIDQILYGQSCTGF